MNLRTQLPYLCTFKIKDCFLTIKNYMKRIIAVAFLGLLMSLNVEAQDNTKTSGCN